MPRRNPPSFDFYPDDFMGGTYYMDATAVGMYIRSICYQWSNDSLPNDLEQLARIMGVSRDRFDKYWPEVEEKLQTDGNGALFNVRLKAEKDKKLGISDTRAEAGRKGGLAKAKQMLSKRGSKNVAKGSRKKEEGSRKKEKGSWTLEDLTWPESLDNETGQAALAEWVEYKRQRGEGYKATNGPQKVLNEFADIGADGLRAAVDHSIACNYAGVFPKNANSPAQPKEKPFFGA